MEIAGGAALHRSWRDEFNTSFQVQSALEGKPVRIAIFMQISQRIMFPRF